MKPHKLANNHGLFWQLLAGTGPIGQILSGIGSILFGLTFIGVSEFIDYANRQTPDPTLTSHSIHPPSRQQTPEEQQTWRIFTDCIGGVILLQGVKTLLSR